MRPHCKLTEGAGARGAKGVWGARHSNRRAHLFAARSVACMRYLALRAPLPPTGRLVRFTSSSSAGAGVSAVSTGFQDQYRDTQALRSRAHSHGYSSHNSQRQSKQARRQRHAPAIASLLPQRPRQLRRAAARAAAAAARARNLLVALTADAAATLTADALTAAALRRRAHASGGGCAATGARAWSTSITSVRPLAPVVGPPAYSPGRYAVYAGM